MKPFQRFFLRIVRVRVRLSGADFPRNNRADLRWTSGDIRHCYFRNDAVMQRAGVMTPEDCATMNLCGN